MIINTNIIIDKNKLELLKKINGDIIFPQIRHKNKIIFNGGIFINKNFYTIKKKQKVISNIETLIYNKHFMIIKNKELNKENIFKNLHNPKYKKVFVPSIYFESKVCLDFSIDYNNYFEPVNYNFEEDTFNEITTLNSNIYHSLKMMKTNNFYNNKKNLLIIYNNNCEKIINNFKDFNIFTYKCNLGINEIKEDIKTFIKRNYNLFDIIFTEKYIKLIKNNCCNTQIIKNYNKIQNELSYYKKTLAVLFLTYKNTECLNEFLEFISFFKHLFNITIYFIINDRETFDNYNLEKHNINIIKIYGDNTNFEFTGFQKCINERNELKSFDFILFTNETLNKNYPIMRVFNTFNPNYIVNNNFKYFGLEDKFDFSGYKYRLLNYSFNFWFRANFVLINQEIFRKINYRVYNITVNDIFKNNSREIKINIDPKLVQKINNWLNGERYKKKKYDLIMFQKKFCSIINEYLLSILILK